MSNDVEHILLVDDQPLDLSEVVKLLKSRHYRVSQASSPRSGYHRARTLKPDLIVLDLYMPGMDGFSLCRLLKEDASTKHIPVIFLSSSKTVEERIEGLELGGVDFVTKPCSPEELLARIRVHLQLLKAHCQQDAAPGDTADPPELVMLNAATRLIQSDLENVPTLPEIARAVGTYEKKLLQIFRNELGTTVFAFIREARMEKAKSLLADNTLIPVEEIAAMVGFRSPANFSTAFRKREGVSPSHYRRIRGGSPRDEA